MSFLYPTTQAIKAVEAERLPYLTRNRPIFDLMPIVDEDSNVLRWEQEDNYTGLQQVRGLGGQPSRVKAVGGKTFLMEPGFYGEFTTLDEVILMGRRQYGTTGTEAPVRVDDLVMKDSEKLQLRFLDRVEMVGWKALGGTFTVLGAAGAVIHEDTFPVQTMAAAASWSANPATATPLKDLRNAKLLARGRGVSFGRQAKAYLNAITVNALLGNLNPNDLFGKKDQNQSTITGLDALNKIMVAADLPEIVEQDGGYLDDAGVYQTFIPDGVVRIVGVRPSGGAIMDYAMVRNVNNPNMEPGQYTRVIDKGDDEIPRIIEVHNGHNGGPRIYQPGSVVSLNVA